MKKKGRGLKSIQLEFFFFFKEATTDNTEIKKNHKRIQASVHQ